MRNSEKTHCKRGHEYSADNTRINNRSERICRACEAETRAAKRAPKKSFEQRFWEKVAKTDTCWLWTSARTRTGYGQIISGDKVLAAHRVAYEFANGPISAGLVVRHTCDNPSCVNPAHLLVGNVMDNTLDMIARGRGANQKKTHCPKGHPYDSVAIRPGTGRIKRQCRKCRAESTRKREQLKKSNSDEPVE